MFTNTICISKAHRSFICQFQASSHACLLMANYTTYKRERRCSLTSTHYRATSRKLKPVSEDTQLDRVWICSVRTLVCKTTVMQNLLYSRCVLGFGGFKSKTCARHLSLQHDQKKKKISLEHRITISLHILDVYRHIFDQLTFKVEIKWSSAWFKSYLHVSSLEVSYNEDVGASIDSDCHQRDLCDHILFTYSDDLLL